jgi:hypothetical protein
MEFFAVEAPTATMLQSPADGTAYKEGASSI